MKTMKAKLRGLIICLFGLTFAACGGGANDAGLASRAGDATSRLLADSAVCYATWSSNTVYTGGNKASRNGVNYQANWWTQGDDPATHHGGAGSGQPWTSIGMCGAAATSSSASSASATTTSTTASTSTTTTSAISTNASTACKRWSEGETYTAGQVVSYLGAPYTALVPHTAYVGAHWNPQDTPSLWTPGGTCSGITAAPVTTTTATPSLPPSTPAGTGATTTTSATPSTTTTAAAPSGFLFSPYKDVTVNMNWNTNVISTKVGGSLRPLLSAMPSSLRTVTWAFATGECGNENWGGIAGATLASANVQAFTRAGKNYILSTGGAAGSFTCGSDAGFESFIQRYASPNLVGVDFDIEAGQSQEVINNLVQRVKVAQGKHPGLRFSFTLATLAGNTPQSLGAAGVNVMNAIRTAGLTNYYINLMVMDYGAAIASNCTLGQDGKCDMGQSAAQAAINLHAHWGVPYDRIELTPMIGGNDVQDEVFTLANVDWVSHWAKQQGVGGIHYWSLDRDIDCAPGYASPVCNSYGQAGNWGFAKRFVTALGL